jgi:hypothetical protein
MTATLSRPAVEGSEASTAHEFRFSDANPLTSGTYAQSMFRDLPEHVASVVDDHLFADAATWDALVEFGEVFDFVGPHEVFWVWKTATGYGVRHFLRPGHEVIRVSSLDAPEAWF